MKYGKGQMKMEKDKDGKIVLRRREFCPSCGAKMRATILTPEEELIATSKKVEILAKLCARMLENKDFRGYRQTKELLLEFLQEIDGYIDGCEDQSKA